ncbi:hypothetical protein OESDEN_02956 [Oesophagostomum dentatum]|uniref:Serine-threonine/tyrosine-protein kinase catalytic domain-containing protein n=1 Tax=Oesophagostomum dentatum TaxID=61180 RepID=A0A0B1TNV6_OESDE|nr:hypothetical protein OESDEN_02956 [Oesophagostomum dentatum]
MIQHILTEISIKAQEVILRNPVIRQSWELSHDDVELTKKLGEGAFGEVHMGRLKLKSGMKVTVAVKLVCVNHVVNEFSTPKFYSIMEPSATHSAFSSL